MNSIVEARGITMKHLEKFLVSNGFAIKLNKAKEAQIERKTKTGFDSVGIGMLDYRPYYKITYGFNKINLSINEILLRLQQIVPLSPKEEKKSRFLFFSYNTIKKPAETSYLPDMLDEADVKRCVDLMIGFMKETALPWLEKFEDLREIEKVINGETPWETDWHKPFTLGGNFHLKRLIISRLSGSGSYDRILEFVRQDFQSHFEDQYGSDYRQALVQVEELNKTLADVKSLY
jgi:hypothetical protein